MRPVVVEVEPVPTFGFEVVLLRREGRPTVSFSLADPRAGDELVSYFKELCFGAEVEEEHA